MGQYISNKVNCSLSPRYREGHPYHERTRCPTGLASTVGVPLTGTLGRAGFCDHYHTMEVQVWQWQPASYW